MPDAEEVEELRAQNSEEALRQQDDSLPSILQMGLSDNLGVPYFGVLKIRILLFGVLY